MIQAIQKRLQKEEQGFTLIELMVVVLIIAILVAIAIPTFLGARRRAQDRAVQSDLRNGLLAAEVHYVDTESYDAAAADLEAIEPELNFDDLAVAVGQMQVVSAANDIVLIGQSESDDGTPYFCIAKSESAGTTYDTGAAAADVDTLAECNGTGW